MELTALPVTFSVKGWLIIKIKLSMYLIYISICPLIHSSIHFPLGCNLPILFWGTRDYLHVAWFSIGEPQSLALWCDILQSPEQGLERPLRAQLNTAVLPLGLRLFFWWNKMREVGGGRTRSYWISFILSAVSLWIVFVYSLLEPGIL